RYSVTGGRDVDFPAAPATSALAALRDQKSKWQAMQWLIFATGSPASTACLTRQNAVHGRFSRWSCVSTFGVTDHDLYEAVNSQFIHGSPRSSNSCGVMR